MCRESLVALAFLGPPQFGLPAGLGEMVPDLLDEFDLIDSRPLPNGIHRSQHVHEICVSAKQVLPQVELGFPVPEGCLIIAQRFIAG